MFSLGLGTLKTLKLNSPITNHFSVIPRTLLCTPPRSHAVAPHPQRKLLVLPAAAAQHQPPATNYRPSRAWP